MNKPKNLTAIIIAAVALLLVLWGVSGYNGIVEMDENVNNQWANVEAQYQRRTDLIPNLVSTVKGYAAHEKSTLGYRRHRCLCFPGWSGLGAGLHPCRRALSL